MEDCLYCVPISEWLRIKRFLEEHGWSHGNSMIGTLARVLVMEHVRGKADVPSEGIKLMQQILLTGGKL